MTQKQRETIIRVIGMLDGLSYHADTDVSVGISDASEALQSLLETSNEDAG